MLPGTALSGGLETTGSRGRPKDQPKRVLTPGRDDGEPERGRGVSGRLSQSHGTWLGLEGQLRIYSPECCREGEEWSLELRAWLACGLPGAQRARDGAL